MDGEIVEEVKKGYYIKDKVLRPSHVIVAKKKSWGNPPKDRQWLTLKEPSCVSNGRWELVGK